MFWYNAAVSGAYCVGFNNCFEYALDSWASTPFELEGWYVTIKAGALTGHASYGNLYRVGFMLDFAGAAARLSERPPRLPSVAAAANRTRDGSSRLEDAFN
ncbi:hypothetical protein FS837_001856 [Tulasnella sp. UAMH 9824]|nr:hypothetical protein FS837_001856 [Tulasnella sp. UAMH 9824]